MITQKRGWMQREFRAILSHLCRLFQNPRPWPSFVTIAPGLRRICPNRLHPVQPTRSPGGILNATDQSQFSIGAATVRERFSRVTPLQSRLRKTFGGRVRSVFFTRWRPTLGTRAGLWIINQMISRQRVIDHGEVFTPPGLVNDMLDLVQHECERIDSRFLEPACGDGNFLAEVLRRKLATDETTPEQRVAELVGFLPVLQYDGSSMRQLNAEAILDIATAGTSATLLAKRWESVLLVNVDDSTLTRLMNDPAAMAALEAIEGFRNLNADLETIINRSEQIKDAKRKAGEGEEPSAKKKKELTEAEKERKSLRKQVQEKLIKFAARIPVFMYLTDYREQRLKDVITRLEPGLFKKVTGLTTADFERLVSLGVFNSALMNDAVWKFRRYEDSSLRYMGVSRHKGLDVGLYDTALTEEDFRATFEGVEEKKGRR